MVHPKAIWYYRLQKGLTQAELAAQIGAPEETVAAYESGTVALSKKSLEKVAAALEISLGKLFAYTTPNLEIVWSHFTMADDLPDWA